MNIQQFATTFKRFCPYLSKQKGRMVLAYSLSLSGVLLTLAMPWPLKFLIDNVLAHDSEIPELLAFTTVEQVFIMAFAMLILAFVTAVALSFENIVHARVREQFAYQLRDDLIQHIYRLSRSSRQAERSGELTMRLISDAQLVSRLFCKTAPNTLKLTGTSVLTLLSIFLISQTIGVLALAMAVVLALIVILYGPRVTNAARQRRHLEGETAALTQETINAIEHVQSMALESQSRKKYLSQAAASLEAGVKQVAVAVSMERTTQIFAGLALASVAGVGGMMVANGGMSIGTLTVCLAYITALLKPIEKINALAIAISRGLVRSERVLAIFSSSTAIDTGEYDISVSNLNTIDEIQCSDVVYQYPHDSAPTIDGFSYCFSKGYCTAIVGPSGSGKSTLLRLLLRLQPPTSGILWANGFNYESIHATALRSHFSVLMQDAHLFSGTIREVLTELAPEADDSLLYKCLADVELSDLIHALPNRLDSQIDEAGARISGGQLARLLLARTLVGQRPVVILDEPFANIDAISKRVIVGRLKELKRECILIVVTHEDTLLEIADQVIQPIDWNKQTPREADNAIFG